MGTYATRKVGYWLFRDFCGEKYFEALWMAIRVCSFLGNIVSSLYFKIEPYSSRVSVYRNVFYLLHLEMVWLICINSEEGHRGCSNCIACINSIDGWAVRVCWLQCALHVYSQCMYGSLTIEFFQTFASDCRTFKTARFLQVFEM